ncbi:MAG: Crp/Fnr family transcriptional regulator [Clostridia bacterium]|nr:Crp/Fnr family transcriptional regulator [Clostridia bacterium]
MKKYFNVLKLCPLFNGLDEEKLSTMLNCLGAKVESFDKKYTIFSEGKPQKYIGILLSGSAQIIQIDYFGNRSILSDIEAGNSFAEAFACNDNSILPVSIIANEPCEVMFINSRHILHTCTNCCDFHQQLIYNLMKELAKKNIAFYQKIDVTSKRTTREKLLTYLAYQAKRAGSNRFTIPFDRQALADYLEVDRSGLSVEISKLKKEGVLDTHKNLFELF